MNRINIQKWKYFHLYDKHMFYIDMGNKFDKSKMDTTKNDINFIGRTSINNGINATCGVFRNVQPYKSGLLTLALGGSVGSCFIQKRPFYTSQNVIVLIPKDNISDYAKHYVACIIQKESELHYQAFVKELNAHIKTDFIIPLPATKNDEPDWIYMESYMKRIMQETQKTIEELLNINTYKSKININNWNNFKIGGENGLFEVTRPNARSVQTYNKGNMPFIASGCFNNGVSDYFEPKSESDFDKGNCITVSPVDGYAFYQKDDFLGRGGAGSSIIILRCDNLNEYIGKFICTIIRNTCKDWSYSNMGNKDKLRDTIIKLPATEKGDPDWIFMEQYMKNVLKDTQSKLNKII